jgi:hypothetical protein
MPAGKTNLYIEKGATFHKSITWEVAGNPVDLTGYSARMMIRASYAAASPLIELTTSNGRIALNGAPGRIDLFIGATDTEALAGSAGVYDLELVNGAEVTRLLQGEVTLSPEVTHA